MRKGWAISGLDLHLEVRRDGATGIRVRLESALREAVRTGRLGPGTRLPSSRALAADLGLARNTVAEAYGQLVAEGWLTARQGSGPRVAGPANPSRPPGPESHSRPTQPSPPIDLNSPTELTSPSGGSHPPRYPVEAGAPALSPSPRAARPAGGRPAFPPVPSHALGYGHPQGRP